MSSFHSARGFLRTSRHVLIWTIFKIWQFITNLFVFLRSLTGLRKGITWCIILITETACRISEYINGERVSGYFLFTQAFTKRNRFFFVLFKVSVPEVWGIRVPFNVRPRPCTPPWYTMVWSLLSGGKLFTVIRISSYNTLLLQT